MRCRFKPFGDMAGRPVFKRNALRVVQYKDYMGRIYFFWKFLQTRMEILATTSQSPIKQQG